MKKIYVLLVFLLVMAGCMGEQESVIENLEVVEVEEVTGGMEVEESVVEEEVVLDPEVIYGEDKDGAKYFKVYAEKDRVFKVNDFVNPDLIVNVGDLVRVDFKSNLEGDSCDFVIDELGVKSNSVSGAAVTGVDFVAEEAGVYEYYCTTKAFSEKGMKGRFIVE